MVHSAFISELSLKCLRCKQDGTVPHGHHLKYHYRDLARSTRRRIEKRWDEYIPSQAEMWDFAERELGRRISRDLESALSTGARKFEEMRYMFEESATQAQFMILDLPHILRAVILAMRPEWEGALLLNPIPDIVVDRTDSTPKSPKPSRSVLVNL